MGDSDGNGENYLFAYRQSDGLSYYQAKVGPLCAFDFGPIDEDFAPSCNSAEQRTERLLTLPGLSRGECQLYS